MVKCIGLESLIKNIAHPLQGPQTPLVLRKHDDTSHGTTNSKGTAICGYACSEQLS